MKRGEATFHVRRYRRLGVPNLVTLPWGRYERHVHLFWRIRIPLCVGLASLGWLALRGPGIVAGIIVAIAIEAAVSFRKVGRTAAPTVIRADADRQARERAQHWESAQPSPGGWHAPAGKRPAWNWTPPGSLKLRLDRMPRWVRVWYRIPFADRFARSWMWHRGGWDVLPPNSE